MNYFGNPLLASLALIILILAGCSKSQGHAIEDVLNRCARTAKRVNNSKMSAAEAAVYLANEAQKIDTRDCPPEFRAAFQANINAWREAAGYFSRNTALSAALEGFAAGYFQDSTLYGASQQNAAMATQNINSTYYQLVNIAAAYGARVPTSVVNR